MSNIKNEIYPELASMSALNPFTPNVHSSRGAMFTGNLGQFLLVNGATPRHIYSGVERDYGKATFSQGFDRDVEIIKVIPRYPDAGRAGVPARHNPSTLVIFEDYETKEVGCLNLTEYHSTHQHFGFRYKKNEDVLSKLMSGATIPAGTRVYQSPNLLPDGDYMFGLETNVLFSSDPAVIEDGIKVSEAFLDRIIPTGYGTLQVEFGKGYFPINLYGDYTDPDNYKIIPNIGESISTDGLLICLREHNDIVNVVNMTTSGICKPDYIYDRKNYAIPSAKVVDIRVNRNTSINIPPMPVGTDAQLMWYWEADNSYYRKILDVYWGLRAGQHGRGIDMRMSPEFHSLVVEAIHRCGVDYRPEGRQVGREFKEMMDVRSEYRGVPLDAWRLEIVYEHKSIPNDGFKLTDYHGGKGVICRVVPTEDMPIDDNGNRVEVIMDDLSTTRRINAGRFYEQYLNASGRDTVKRMKDMVGYDLPEETSLREIKSWLKSKADSSVRELETYILGFYEIVSPKMVEKYNEVCKEDSDYVYDHLAGLFKSGHRIFFPINNPVHRPSMIRDLKDKYPAIKTPLNFRGYSGNMCRTKVPMLVGSMYFMVLEKTAEDWSAVASAKLQVYGTTARLNRFDKDSAPGRQNVVKTIGESESRSLAACIGGEEVADIMDATNNPLAHKAIYQEILTNPTPTNIDVVLDRDEIPKGGHRPRNYVTHILECSGKRFTRK